MKIIEKEINLCINYPIEKLGRISGLLFFDIETTGLNASTCAAYLIGTLCFAGNNYKNGGQNTWLLRQYFSENFTEECDMLKSFSLYARAFDTVLSYNGEGFDLPFLEKISAQYRIPFPLNAMDSLDIYKKIRKYRKYINTPKLNQKSIEEFLGIYREDMYSGGELIEIYEQYKKSPDRNLLHKILLHNEEDLIGIASILPVLNYPDLWEKTPRYRESRPEADTVSLLYSSQAYLPQRLYIDRENFILQAEGGHINLKPKFYRGSAKYFYPNYKDYYYLPAEDMAIHKSVGKYVDSPHRKNANRNNAYIKKDSLYIPWFGDDASSKRANTPPVFYIEKRGSQGYMEFDKFNALPANQKEKYLQNILASLI